MTIEEEIFKKCEVNYPKLIDCGFNKTNGLYIYTTNIMENRFQVEVTINEDGKVTGKIWDKQNNEEYINFRLKELGNFSSQVKEEYLSILQEIQNKCFSKNNFASLVANEITQYIKDEYNDNPEFLWPSDPGFAVFRHSNNHKWYGIIMNISYSKLDKKRDGEVEIINLKLSPEEIASLLKCPGYYPAYHMNKKYWVTIVLDGTIKLSEIKKLVQKSYNLTIN